MSGEFISVWIAHERFGMPTAMYLIYNYCVSNLSLKSPLIDVNSHFTFTSISRPTLPLSVPVILPFAIFQILWICSDHLVALISIKQDRKRQILTQCLASIVGTRGKDWYLLTTGAFLASAGVLFLQRLFVRRLVAGSVKGLK